MRAALSVEQLDRMRKLWERSLHLTARDIGERFGVSRNSVIGHAARRRWAARGEVPPPVATIECRLAALDLFPARGGCVFPIGDPRRPGFRFCGAAVPLPGSPYCDEHLKVCHVADQGKRDALKAIDWQAKRAGPGR